MFFTFSSSLALSLGVRDFVSIGGLIEILAEPGKTRKDPLGMILLVPLITTGKTGT